METIITSDSGAHEFIDMLLEGLTQFNAEATGQRDGKDLSVAVQGDGKTVGGCYGWTWAGTWCCSFTCQRKIGGRA